MHHTDRQGEKGRVWNKYWQTSTVVVGTECVRKAMSVGKYYQATVDSEVAFDAT